ncbi:IS66 family insertion sequence element accessory protein TnpA [Thiolapillus brandeum]|uniref:Transposase, IS66 orf1 family n=1 Tax=Thiolapillus brandeum TaxID=1076588 RepID=A0A7U6GLG6_9GAMM|nr:hypothetical protein [Thiolapillus brandeum]BAO45091.1 transposase, IS66 orf1 family [Thiolapillus brandeum]BAO45768.1 conserved hypothetical protein [Thiolapillus brandeum]
MNKRRSKNEWQRLIEEQAASGLTRKAFCEQAGIAVATFGYWKRKLRAEGDKAGLDKVASTRRVSLDDWIELSPPVTEPAPGWHIELDLGNGLCLRLHQG